MLFLLTIAKPTNHIQLETKDVYKALQTVIVHFPLDSKSVKSEWIIDFFMHTRFFMKAERRKDHDLAGLRVND